MSWWSDRFEPTVAKCRHGFMVGACSRCMEATARRCKEHGVPQYCGRCGGDPEKYREPTEEERQA